MTRDELIGVLKDAGDGEALVVAAQDGAMIALPVVGVAERDTMAPDGPSVVHLVVTQAAVILTAA